MKKKLKKVSFGIIVALLVIFSIHTYVEYKSGTIDYRGTWMTEYSRTGNSKYHQVETSWSIIETPKNWRHIALITRCPPGTVGAFWTNHGLINYEYGIYAPVYEEDPNSAYSVRIDTSSNIQLYIAKDNESIGIHIPQQEGMSSGLTFWSTSTDSALTNELIASMKKIRYKY